MVGELGVEAREDEPEEEAIHALVRGSFRGIRSELRIGAVVLNSQQGDRGFEVVEGVERLIDAREAKVGDLVELTQRREDGEPDVVRLDLGDAGRTDRLLDAL